MYYTAELNSNSISTKASHCRCWNIMLQSTAHPCDHSDICVCSLARIVQPMKSAHEVVATATAATRKAGEGRPDEQTSREHTALLEHDINENILAYRPS